VRAAGDVLLDQAELRVTVTAGSAAGGAPGRPRPGARFTVVDNAGDGEVVGSFRGLPDGATVIGRTPDGRPAWFRIAYHGGDGNDVVLEALRAPDPAPRPVVLVAVAGQAVDEGEPLALRLHADPGEPANPLRWRLLGRPPAGLRLDRGGALHWIPRETQGPGRYTVVARVEDAGDPDRHDQRSFTVTVGESTGRRCCAARRGRRSPSGPRCGSRSRPATPTTPAPAWSTASPATRPPARGSTRAPAYCAGLPAAARGRACTPWWCGCSTTAPRCWPTPGPWRSPSRGRAAPPLPRRRRPIPPRWLPHRRAAATRATAEATPLPEPDDRVVP
jgi:hypothetical protein